MNPQFITSSEGKPIAVQISYRRWLRIQKDLRALHQIRKISDDLHEAIEEVQKHNNGEIALPTLSDCIDALHNPDLRHD